MKKSTGIAHVESAIMKAENFSLVLSQSCTIILARRADHGGGELWLRVADGVAAGQPAGGDQQAAGDGQQPRAGTGLFNGSYSSLLIVLAYSR